jgi:membrane peptidoglycan carboxypeptidase
MVMQTVVDRGTGVAADIGRPAAGKTGTSESWRDAWFDGFVPQLAAAVWVGNPIPVDNRYIESMTPANGYPYRIVGGTIPARIWHDFMAKALEGIRVREFEKPPNIFFQPEPVVVPSDAPTPTATVAATAQLVPDVVDRRLARARAELSDAGFGVAAVRQCDPDEDATPGDVWRQSPAAGAQAPENSTVTLWYAGDECD